MSFTAERKEGFGNNVIGGPCIASAQMRNQAFSIKERLTPKGNGRSQLKILGQ
jgi:hypothetical protein